MSGRFRHVSGSLMVARSFRSLGAFLPLWLLVLPGCPLVSQDEWDAANDRDGDGFLSAVNDGDDCDDDDASVHPGVEEICDGVDNNCDGRTDEGFDADGDSYRSCDGDCDDSDSAVHPGAAEVCDDGVDNDCDGTSNDCALRGERWLDAATARYTGIGTSSKEWAGKGLAGGGDVNGDGIDDLLIGAPYRDGEDGVQNGAAYILLGPATSSRSLGQADATFNGLAAYDLAGWDVAMVGDVNGDALEDVLVGAPYADPSGASSGSVYLFLGRDGSSEWPPLPDFQAVIDGAGAGDLLGYDVGGGGDVDGDGLSDILLGAQGVSFNEDICGAAYLFRGPVTGAFSASQASTVFYGAHTQDVAGKAVAIVDDMDGDGLADLVIGAPNAYAQGDRPGAAYLWSGPASGVFDVADAAATLLGEAEGDHAGETVDSAGDFNADGYGDLLVSAPSAVRAEGEVGVIYLLAGPVVGSNALSGASLRMEGVGDGDWTGWSMAGLGDVDGDGRSDVLVGAPERDAVAANDGTAYLIYGVQTGTLSLLDADLLLIGESGSDYAGGRVAAAGDVDDDGHQDMLIGAYGWNGGDGAAYLQLGAGI